MPTSTLKQITQIQTVLETVQIPMCRDLISAIEAIDDPVTKYLKEWLEIQLQLMIEEEKNFNLIIELARAFERRGINI